MPTDLTPTAFPIAPAAPRLPWGDYRPFPDEAGRNARQASLEVPLMVRSLGFRPGGRILEIGCGRGVALPVLARLLAPTRLTGIDLDSTALAEARERTVEAGITAELVPADVRRMPFPDAAFDLVVDFGTCYHIVAPEQALAEITRVLARGGQFVHETPLSQLLSHPLRSFGRRMPWRSAPGLIPVRTALLWSARRRSA